MKTEGITSQGLGTNGGLGMAGHWQELIIPGILGLALMGTAVAVADSSIDEPLVIGMSISVTDGPVINGKTNLPSGTLLQVSLKPPAPACSPNCAWGWIDATVRGGSFSAGPKWPIAWKRPDGRLNPGLYKLEITTPLVDDQPVEIRSVFDHISGPYVRSLLPGEPMVDYVAPAPINVR